MQSSLQLEGEDKNNKNLTSAQIIGLMKKKPFSQTLNGVQYTYSVLSKKQQTFVLTNNRFLYLKGIESISYAREFQENQKMPFISEMQIPKAKATFSISEIQNFTNEQEKLIIQFSGEKKAKWEFICPSKVCALQWRKKLDFATHTLSEFNQSGFKKYDQFVKNKEMIEAQKYNQSNSGNLLASSAINLLYEPSLDLNSSRSHANQSSTILESPPKIVPPSQTNLQQSTGVAHQNQQNLNTGSKNNLSNIGNVGSIGSTGNMNNVGNAGNLNQNYMTPNRNQLQESNVQMNFEKPKENTLQSADILRQLGQLATQTTPQTNTQNNNTDFKQKEKPSRPNAILFRGSQISKVENFIIQESRPQPTFLSRSIASLPVSQKESIKSQIAKLRRSWIEQLIRGEEQCELILDFKRYGQKVGEVIVNQLYIPKEARMFAVYEESRDHVAYLLDDVYVEIYVYSEENLIQKNQRYKNAVVQFKNFDYYIGETKNKGVLKVPLMMLFEFKGFLGMVKARLGESTRYRNKEAYNLINKRQFQMATRVNADTLLDQNKCKIISPEIEPSFSKVRPRENSMGVYFIEKLVDFLPNEPFTKQRFQLLRPEFVQDEMLDDEVFRDEHRRIKEEKINDLINKKIDFLAKVLENYDDYFTNSKELSQIFHFAGLNIRHIGALYNKVRSDWLRRILQAQLVARCAKNYFRLDIQNSVLQNLEKSAKKERQEERQRARVISFLNILFGNTEATFRMWRNLNNSSQQLYHTRIWEKQFTNINVNYLLQAIQTNFKIVLADNISERNFFKSMSTFENADFQRFQFDATIYSLDFTQIFDEIHECLEEQTFESFQQLCNILTSNSPKGIPYFTMLKNHPVHDKISQFLLQFTSPDDNADLYSKIESKGRPSRFNYESVLAQIRWYLKSGKHDNISKAVNFIEEQTQKWLGKVHPLFTILNRIQAEYYSQKPSLQLRATKYAFASLQMQQQLFQGDCEQTWKDNYLLGKIYFLNNNIQQSLKYLLKAKQMVKIQHLPDYQLYGQLCLLLAKSLCAEKRFKESYSTLREFYKLVRQERDDQSLVYIIDTVSLIKYILEMNQEHESFFLFVQSDFSQIVGIFANTPQLMIIAIKTVAVPYLKNVLLRNSKYRVQILTMLDHISKIALNSSSCQIYLKSKIAEGVFPRNYLRCLREIDSVMEQIQKNQMVERWKSYNKMANQSLLDKINSSQINRGFEFLANLTAIINFLGPEVLQELFIIQK